MPEPYQERAIRFCVERGAAGLFLDPSLGKTSIMLAAFKLLKAAGQTKGALVLAPLRVAHSVWPGEVSKWRDFRGFSIAVLHGSKKSMLLKERHDIYVINYEGLAWLYDELSTMDDWPFDTLIVDESSKVRNMMTARFKLLKPMLPAFRRRYILTGSPAPRSLLNLYGQIFILDGGASLGKWFGDYRAKYFMPMGYGGYEWVLKTNAEKEIHTAIAPLVLRMAAEDYMKLPPVVVNDVWVTLPPAARKIYKTMEDDLFAELRSGKLIAKNVGVSIGKCRQITGGAVYASGVKRTWDDVHDEKIKAVEGLVEEIEGRGALILYEYEHELERLQKVFPGAPVIGGRVSAKENLRIEKEWNARRVPIMFGHPASMAHGLNLHDGGYAEIWITPTWDYELYDQAIRRLRRVRRAEPVFVHRILARDTVDEAVIASLGTKAKRQNALLDALRDYWKDRRV